MEQLPQRDVRALLQVIQDGHGVADRAAFARYVIDRLPTLVTVDSISCNELGPTGELLSMIRTPPQNVIEFGRLKQLLRQHPLVAHFRGRRDPRWLRTSDVITRTRWHRLPIYDEYYRPAGIEHQLAMIYPVSSTIYLGIALNRGGREFRIRDQLLLNLLSPHLLHGYRVAIARAAAQELVLVRRGVDTIGHGLVVLDEAGRMCSATPRARECLGSYFGWPRPPCHPHRLPTALGDWARRQTAAVAAGRAPLPAPFVAIGEGARLAIRLVSDGALTILLFEEQGGAVRTEGLRCLGLTPREAEVLRWVAQGKTNPEIAIILGRSSRTIQHQLEHVFQKLGVENRTAAATIALQTHGLTVGNVGLPAR